MCSRQQPWSDWSTSASASGMSGCPSTDRKAAVDAAEFLSFHWSFVSSLSQIADAVYVE